MTSNSALSPASLIAAAFKCDDVVSKQTTTGIQTMAAAILAHHSEKESRRPSIAQLATRGEAFSDFKAEVVAAYVMPRMKAADGKPDVVASNNTKNATQMVLLNKGFDLAFALDACNVGLASFITNKDGGLFHVPVSALIANDDTPLGALHTATEKDTRIALDGKTYAIMHNEKFTNIKAFPARVLELAGYKKPGSKKAAPVVPPSNGASDTTTSGSAPASEIRNDPNTWSFAMLLDSAAKSILRAYDIAKEGEAVSWSSLDDATRNALDGLAIFRDECKHQDAVQQSKAA